MSNTSTASQPKTDTDTATPNTPGLISRAINSATNAEHNFAMSHPIVATGVGVGLAYGAAQVAAPVMQKAVTGAKRVFGGLARKSSEKVTQEVAGEGVRAFAGGAGKLSKLFR